MATINIVDDSPEARDDLDSVSTLELAEGNVITGLGTDAGPSLGAEFTPFASQGGGVDRIVDDADITSFTYRGETFDLDYSGASPAGSSSGTLSWTFSNELDLDGNQVNQVNVTDSSDNTTLIFRSNGFYSFSPDDSPSFSVDTTSQANVDASDLDISIRAGGTALQFSGDGVGVAGGNGQLLSQGEAIIIDFDGTVLAWC